MNVTFPPPINEFIFVKFLKPCLFNGRIPPIIHQKKLLFSFANPKQNSTQYVIVDYV